MKRYRFTLESALRARRAQEDLARQRLAEANHRVQRAWAVHRAAVAAYREAVQSGSAGAVDSGRFALLRAGEVQRAEAIEAARRAAMEAEVEASTLYSAWVEAGKQVASLERLDERRRAEWEVDARRDEAVAVDDVVAARWSPTAGVDR